MIRNVQKLSHKEYDLLIIGGGINGAALANIASQENLSVALIEKNDFASGTSSKSTKLVHGGLRYLENFEFDLVRESLKERYIQFKNAPHLVKPLKIVIPVYKKDRRPFWMMKLGVTLYDFLSGRYVIGRHKSLTKEEVVDFVPGIETEELLGGVVYFDAQMDDARLCLENVLMADEHGADVANYVEAKSFIKGEKQVLGVVAEDTLANQTFEIKAKQIICTAGPWTNQFLKMDDERAEERVRTTKGIHVVYPSAITKEAMLITSHHDNRIFFVIPFRGNTLIGTTDTDFSDDPDQVKAENEDVNYLFSELKRVFPQIEFTQEKIITTFAGLRPLVKRGGSPSKVSRNHVIYQAPSGVVFVMGGKYTTYRKIAIDTLNKALERKISVKEEEYPLYGSGEIPETTESLAQKYDIDEKCVDHLKNIYGSRACEVLELTQGDTKLKNRLDSLHPAIGAEVVYALKTEMAETSDDIIWRRLSIGYDLKDLFKITKTVNQFIKEYR